MTAQTPAAARPSFHVLNGESTLALLRKTAVPGEFLVWPDMLMEGPLACGKDGRPDAARRAAFLAGSYGVAKAAAADRLKAFAKALDAAARSNGEVTLWFEEDFFCQIHLLCLLATVPAPLRRKGRLSVICPEDPLGRRSPTALERLYKDREPASAARIALARKVWKALTSPKGKPEALLKRPGAFKAWPLLKAGLAAHLDRRPAAGGPRKGLGSLEIVLLDALPKSGKSIAFPDLFRKAVRHRRLAPLGLGDAQVAVATLGLAAAPQARLRIEGMDLPEPVLKADMDFGKWKVARA
jgi:hypothetical protein